MVWLIFWVITRRQKSNARRLLPAMFCAGATGAILVGARLVATGLQSSLELMNYVPPTEPLPFTQTVLRDNWLLLLALLWTTFIFGGAAWESARRYKARREPQASGWKMGIGVVSWAFVIVFTIPGFGYMVEIVPANFDDALFYAVLLIFAMLALLASVVSLQRTQGRQRVLVMAIGGAFWLTVSMLILSSLIEDATLYGQIAVLSAVALVASALGLVFQNENFASELAARTRVAAGVLALLCAVAYLGISLWTVPVERQARVQMQRQLQIGEVAWLREQIEAGQ